MATLKTARVRATRPLVHVDGETVIIIPKGMLGDLIGARGPEISVGMVTFPGRLLVMWDFAAVGDKDPEASEYIPGVRRGEPTAVPFWEDDEVPPDAVEFFGVALEETPDEEPK